MKRTDLHRWLLVLGLGLLVCANVHAQASDPPPEAAASRPALDPATAAPAMTDIHDIKPLVPIPLKKMWLYLLLAVLAALLLLAAGFWLWRHKHRPQEEATIAPPLPPEEVALAAIAQLAADRKRFIDGQTFYFRLSDILRQYIDQRYELGASKMTTEEFVPLVETLNLALDLKRPLINLCQGADPIKFARASVDNLKMETDLRFVEDFVKQTTPDV